MVCLRGYSLPMVLLLMSVLAAAGTAAVVVMTATAEATSTMINRRQAFYACDGIGRGATVKARDYMRNDPTPTTSELQTAVCGSTTGCANAATFAPSGFAVDTLTLSTTGQVSCTVNSDCASNLCQGTAPSRFCSDVRPLPNGPFRGMNARQTNLGVVVEATKSATDARCRIEENISLGEIGLFQFFVFSDGYTDLIVPPTMSINGRVHVNGDFCAYSTGNTLSIDTVTASGRILSGANCPRYAPNATSSSNYSILDAATTSTYRTITGNNDATCTSCVGTPGTGAWRGYSQTRWNGNAQDSEHNVPNLRLPVIGGAAVADGLDASGNPQDNSLSLRMLLDPVRSGDNPSILAQRYASKADIVIVNGIWFKKTVGVPWPGEPIWSDHPGNYQTNCSNDEGSVVCAGGASPVGVGQADLFSSGARPTHYSYYVTDPATGFLGAPDFTQRPVISYGPVVNAGANDFRPAYWSGDNSTDLTAVTTAAHAMDGTRSGFRDFRIDTGDASATTDQILPMNFDLQAFREALNDNSDDELGAHFPDGADAGSAPDFNGIVYIVNTWPGWDANMNTAPTAAAAPTLWPGVEDGAAGSTATATLSGVLGSARPSSGTRRENTRVPYNFCRTGSTVTNLLPGATAFAAPACNAVAQTRPNAVRFINGAMIDPATFPKGLAIASNQGVYILGDLNTGSVALGVGTQPLLVPASAANWRPLMIGGDAITLLSNNWNDFDADWADSRNSSNLGDRNPSQTTWAFASISGSVPTSASWTSGGVNNFPRFLESWTGTQARIYGSLVIGFRSIYQRQPFVWPGSSSPGGSVYTAPDRKWLYDINFNLPANQPPGTPSFFVQAVQTWKRE